MRRPSPEPARPFLLLGEAHMEGVTLLILVTPLLAAIAAKLGIDPIHFGMVVVVNVVLGAITPPFGQLVFFVSSMTSIPPEAPFREVFRFLPLLLLVLGIVTYVPESLVTETRCGMNTPRLGMTLPPLAELRAGLRRFKGRRSRTCRP
jgi:TRAP-type C4-dicarboxylate transport system permease large subunit